MARRILSADSALMATTQTSLQPSVRTEARGGFFQKLQDRWAATLEMSSGEVLFDWDDPTELMNEIAFVNQARERLDEAALKIAPAMLRIVLTVKAHLPEPKAQRAFLLEHMDWDFRRISELCIVAESYGLLDPGRRRSAQGEIQRYGWSNALKLAYVPDPMERGEIWERARAGRPKASYRAILEEIKRFRERKLVGPPAPAAEIGARLLSTRQQFEQLDAMAGNLNSPEGYREVLRQVGRAQQELGRLKRALKERMEASDTEALAANA